MPRSRWAVRLQVTLTLALVAAPATALCQEKIEVPRDGRYVADGVLREVRPLPIPLGGITDRESFELTAEPCGARITLSHPRGTIELDSRPSHWAGELEVPDGRLSVTLVPVDEDEITGDWNWTITGGLPQPMHIDWALRYRRDPAVEPAPRPGQGRVIDPYDDPERGDVVTTERRGQTVERAEYTAAIWDFHINDAQLLPRHVEIVESAFELWASEHGRTWEPETRTCYTEAPSVVLPAVGYISPVGPEAGNDALRARRARAVDDHFAVRAAEESLPRVGETPPAGAGSPGSLHEIPGVESGCNRGASVRFWKERVHAGVRPPTPFERPELAPGPRDDVLSMSPEDFAEDEEAQAELFEKARQVRERQERFGREVLEATEGGDVVSILKRRTQEAFVNGVVAKAERNGYTEIGQMDDMVRGRFDLVSGEDMDRVAQYMLWDQSAQKVRLEKLEQPRRSVEVPECECPGHGYPRYHVIVQDLETGITHEWQVGTEAVSRIYELHGVDLPPGMDLDFETGDIAADLHDVDYDIFRVGVRGHDREHEENMYEELGLDEFGRAIDELSAAAGCQGEDLGDLDERIAELHRQAGTALQRVVDHYGLDQVREWYH